MRKCRICRRNPVVSIPDKTLPSTFALFDKGGNEKGWTYSFPLVDTHLCYLCTKRYLGLIKGELKWSEKERSFKTAGAAFV